MFDTSQLVGFLTAAIVLVLVPGPNTMIILAQSVGGGRGAGLATVAGVELGTLTHTLAAALGLSALLAASALAFTVVKFAGAAYLMIIGVRTFTQAAQQIAGATQLTKLVAFRRALLTNLLNPKSALFFLAFLPQFVRPERGHVFLQFVALGAIVSGVGIVIGAALALTAGSVAQWLQRHTAFQRWQNRFVGAVLIALGVRMAFIRAI